MNKIMPFILFFLVTISTQASANILNTSTNHQETFQKCKSKVLDLRFLQHEYLLDQSNISRLKIIIKIRKYFLKNCSRHITESTKEIHEYMLSLENLKIQEK